MGKPTGGGPQVTIYYNPACSHARGALAILREQGVAADVVEYLQHPPSRVDLERILDVVADAPAELVRKDNHFRELGLDAADYQTRDRVVDLLLAHPELMQRPVVVRGERALICRPSNRVLELLA
jgi:arsenate reductase